jgi:hypothetical protein
MHPRVLASRQGAADDRISRAARELAEQHDLDPALVAGLQVYERDPETRAVMRREAVADLLEALVAGLQVYERDPEPLPDYGTLNVAEAREALEGATEDTLRAVLDYELRHKNRAMIVRDAQGRLG